MHQVAFQAAQDSTEFEISFACAVGFEQRDGVKVRRERTDFANLLRRADEEVFILPVEAAQSAHDIPGIGPDAEVRHAPNVDADLHALI